MEQSIESAADFQSRMVNDTCLTYSCAVVAVGALFAYVFVFASVAWSMEFCSVSSFLGWRLGIDFTKAMIVIE